MRVRFTLPVPTDAAREDMMRVHYAPGRRPRIPVWRWHLLMALLLLPFAWTAIQAVRDAATLELEGRVQLSSGHAGRGLEVAVITGIEQAGRLAPGRSAQLRLPGGGWVEARVVGLSLMGPIGLEAGTRVAVQLRPVSRMRARDRPYGGGGTVAVRFSLLQDLRAWWSSVGAGGDQPAESRRR
ncbi:MAG: hypothetical protein K0Q68_2874 [Moraxellaceae bacterium]|jgi:hypothetical protein|nr:hypothetical protein [Moraxellaceae bacterium]